MRALNVSMKNIRNITVEAEDYYWSLEGNEIYTQGRNIIIGLKGTTYSRLYVDPYAHDFSIGPKSVSKAIMSARKMGWNPESNSGDIYLKSNDGEFFVQSNI